MKKIAVLLAVFLFALSFVSACGQIDKSDKLVDTSETANESVNQKDAKEPTEDPHAEIARQKSLEYLMLLGLDENCSYELRDTFPTGNGDEKSYLLNVTNITDDDFPAIQSSLESNGFNIISDIMEDPDKQARSYQYSNQNDLYIEIVFSYGANYFDVMFTPIYNN